MATQIMSGTFTDASSKVQTRLPVTLIVNAKARTGKEAYKEAIACLKSHDIPLMNACLLEHPDRLTEIIQDHLRRGVKSILVGGGDGSIRSAAGMLLHTDVALGVLPLGTVNDFARNLNIAANIADACTVIATGHTELVDVGQANDAIFLITASLGFVAESLRVLKPQYKRMFGPFGYMVAGLLALHKLRDMRVTLHHGAEVPAGMEGLAPTANSEECLEAIQVGVIKGHYWLGGAVQIPGVDLTTDNMAFYAIPARRRLSLFKMIGMVQHLQHGDFFRTTDLRTFPCTDLTIETPTPQPLVLDGDLCGHTPVHLHVLRNALRVYTGDSRA